MRQDMKIIVGFGEAIRDIPDEVMAILRAHGWDVTDASRLNKASGDFADAAETVCNGICDGAFDRGVLFCGSGIGACMAANRFAGIRAGIAYSELPALTSSNDYAANVLCTGAWMVAGAQQCAAMIEAWLVVGYAEKNDAWLKKIESFQPSIEPNAVVDNPTTVAIGADRFGETLLGAVIDQLKAMDIGVETISGEDEFEIASAVSMAVASGKCMRGILLSNSGQGMNIVANKVPGIRSAVCYEPYTAHLSCADTDANILCFGAWHVLPSEAALLTKIWLMSDYEDKNCYSLARMRAFEMANKNKE